MTEQSSRLPAPLDGRERMRALARELSCQCVRCELSDEDPYTLRVGDGRIEVVWSDAHFHYRVGDRGTWEHVSGWEVTGAASRVHGALVRAMIREEDPATRTRGGCYW